MFRLKVFIALASLAWLPAVGCALQHATLETSSDDDVEVRLDANARVHHARRKLKFFVDVINRSSRLLDLDDLRIELQASPARDASMVSFRKQWTYKGLGSDRQLALRPGAMATLPIVPERNVEFPLELLEPGPYHIVAIVNGRFRTMPYELEVVRPDLRPEPIPLESLRKLLGNGR